MSRYKVTGVLPNGKRFKAIHTNSFAHASGINLYRGSVWARMGHHWRLLWRVYN